MESIAAKENINVSSAEIDGEVSDAVARASAKEQKTVREHYSKGQGRMNLRFKLRQQKTVEFLLGRADITVSLNSSDGQTS